MTIDREAVIRLAREAGAGWRDHSEVDYYTFSPSQLERFATLVLEHGAALSDELLHKEARLALGHVLAERYRNDLLKLMRKVIAADRAARGGAA